MMSSRNSLAVWKALVRCSLVITLTVTPLPWLPSFGLTTTGRPISSAAAQASSASDTVRPFGTGTPAACSSFLVSSLSCAIDSAMALVLSISAAWMRRWRLPQPNITMLPSVRRRIGMSRAMAAETMAPVLGPRRTSSSRSRNCVSAASRSNGVSASAALISDSASSIARRPGFLGIFDHGLVDARLQRLRGAAEGDRATGLRLQSQRRQFQHMRHRDGVGVAGRLQRADAGEARAQAHFEFGQQVDGLLVRAARDDGFDRRVVAPKIGAAQRADAYDFHKSDYPVVSYLLCISACRLGHWTRIAIGAGAAG